MVNKLDRNWVLREAAAVVIDAARRGSKSTAEIDILKEVLAVLERKV
tara:strand:+ start:1181 stop:1321 length:141 start_codon:yes stop_codon:yes gene_type:complete